MKSNNQSKSGINIFMNVIIRIILIVVIVFVITSTLYFYINNQIGNVKEISELFKLDFNNKEQSKEPSKEKQEENNVVEEPKKEEKPEEPKNIPSTDKQISILNSTTVTGLAGKIKKSLESNGFNITNIGNYKKSRLTQTKIIVSQEGMGLDLAKYFNDPIVEQNNEQLPTGIDILIILGESDS